MKGNLEKEFIELVEKIKPLYAEPMKEALERQDNLVKPPKSLGRLEDISVKLAGITGKVVGNSVKNQAILVMSSDNGVVEEGVAVAPQSVTQMQTINMTRRITGVGALAKYFNIQLLVTDLGVKLPIARELYTDKMVENGKLAVKIVDRKISRGTKNLAKEPAMTREEGLRALMTGIEAVKAAKSVGIEIIGIGEMGIGNTTTSSAVLGAITGLSAEEVTGRGGGLNDQGLAKKLEVINQAIDREKGKDILEIITSIGGYDICAMAGAYLGAAIYRMPVVVDGFISMVSALVASKFSPLAKDFMIASHKSFEKGYNIAMEEMGLEPLFFLDMRLGEGSGCPIAFKTVEAACGVMNNMRTFAESSIDDKYLEEVREGNLF